MAFSKEELGAAGIARYEQIIATAIELFERQGYGATSLAQIADAVGIRKATLYYYLDSKVQLLENVYERVTDQLRDVMRSSSTSDHPCQRIAAVIHNHVAFHIHHGAFVRIVWAERYELPAEVYRAVRIREQEYEHFVEETISAGIERGCLEGYEADLLTKGLLGLLTTVYRWPRGTGTDEQFHADVVRLVMRFVFGPARNCPVDGALLPAAVG